MHNLKEFGSTYLQIMSDKIKNVVRFKNQKFNEPMNQVFINTHRGFTRFVKKNKPDLIIVHGDRTEALACAVVGVLSGIKVAHIEGGELSGTVDEILRHSITKLSNIHLVKFTWLSLSVGWAGSNYNKWNIKQMIATPWMGLEIDADITLLPPPRVV